MNGWLCGWPFEVFASVQRCNGHVDGRRSESKRLFIDWAFGWLCVSILAVLFRTGHSPGGKEAKIGSPGNMPGFFCGVVWLN